MHSTSKMTRMTIYNYLKITFKIYLIESLQIHLLKKNLRWRFYIYIYRYQILKKISSNKGSIKLNDGSKFFIFDFYKWKQCIHNYKNSIQNIYFHRLNCSQVDNDNNTNHNDVAHILGRADFNAFFGQHLSFWRIKLYFEIIIIQCGYLLLNQKIGSCT